MTQLVSFARFGMMATLACALASACGGQSFTGTGGDAGSSATAGSGQGGSGHAGTGGKAQAGSTSGGSSSAGFGGASAGTGSTSAGTGSTSSSGGTPNEACAAPPNSGVCDAYFRAWYHDPSTGICRPFVYGGCGGNANRYGSLAECQMACPVSNPNYDSCKAPTDCVVTGTGCCGICDGAGITEHDLIAYNRQYTNVFECGFALDIAGGGTGSAGAAAPIACAPCPLPPAGEGTLKYFVPNCIAGQCVVEDLRKSPVTACKASNECKVRNGTGCCEGCNGGDPVAVRNDGSFEKLVCSPSSVCAGCLPAPSSAVPYCGQDGHCQAVFREDAGG